MKNILHTNLLAVRCEEGEPGEIPLPSLRIIFLLMTRPLPFLILPQWAKVLKLMSFLATQDLQEDFWSVVLTDINNFSYNCIFFIDHPPPPPTNYKHLAAEQINQSRPWVIAQIHAKSFRVKWWSGMHLTPLLSLQANVALPLSFSLGRSVFMVFSYLLVPQGQGLKTALCLKLSSHTLLFFLQCVGVILRWVYSGNVLHDITPEELLQWH